jgi:hypothetical protein
MPRSGECHSPCQLICIDPARVHEFWPHVSPLIAAAMERGAITDIADVECAVLAGRALVWIAIAREDIRAETPFAGWCRKRPDGNGRKRPDGNGTIKAAAVTQLSAVNGVRFCTIVACGASPSKPGGRRRGRDRDEWLPLLAGLERYAKAEDCKAMRIFGRRGWERLLPDYKAARVLLEKELN